MAVGFIDSIQPDLDKVDKLVVKSLNIKAGHLTRFAHLDYSPMEKHLRPSLVILTSRIFGRNDEKVISLAEIIQFIYMAAATHFIIPDTDQDVKQVPAPDPRDGSQIPVLVGDFLYGKFFLTLCEADLLEFLDPLARVIADMNVGKMIDKEEVNDFSTKNTYLEIVQKETASLFSTATRLSAELSGASEDDITTVTDFGRNLGIAYGLLERKSAPNYFEVHINKALEDLTKLPPSPERDTLKELVENIRKSADFASPSSPEHDPTNGELKTSKERAVQSFFNSIAKKYDLMNTILSFGQHIYWRKVTVAKAAVPEGGSALDICCGTGMVTMDLAKKAGPNGRVVGLDFSENMLKIAKEYIKDFPYRDNIELIQGNAMDLPFPDNTFDCITIAYGLRNVPDLKKVLAEMLRVVKPGGRVVSLEFGKPYVPVFKQIYNFYIDKWVPLMGKVSAKNKDAYQYLHDSIVSYPHQHKVTEIYREMGYANPQCFELSWGIVAVHLGIKPETGAKEQEV